MQLEYLANRSGSSSEGSVQSTVPTEEEDTIPEELLKRSPSPARPFEDADDDEEDFSETVDDPDETVSEQVSVSSTDSILKDMRERADELLNLISSEANFFTKNGSFGQVDLSYRFNPRLIARGETLITGNYDLSMITHTLQDLSQSVRPLWDHDFVSGEVISPRELVGENEHLGMTWCAFKGRYGFPGRDFCWNQYTWTNEDKTESIHIAASVAVGSEPEGFRPGQRGNYVRGVTHIGGYKFTVLPEKGTHVVFFNQTDIGSNLPAWITDSVLKKSPSKLEYFRKFITSQ